MSYPLHAFLPSPKELNLATRLLELNSWNRTDSLSVDTAIGIFKQNGLSFKQLREIWSIADKDGNGELAKEDLAIVIRLMGWVQAGETLDESLLRKEGPLPKIKGITDLATPIKTEPELPPVKVLKGLEIKQAFLDANPVNGRLNRPKVMEIFMRIRPTMPFETLFRLMKVVQSEVNDARGEIGFRAFAIGVLLVQKFDILHISSAPILVTPEIYEDLANIENIFSESHSAIGDTITNSVAIHPPTTVDSDIHDLIQHLIKNHSIHGELANKFQSTYNLKPVELAGILRKADINVEEGLSPTWLDKVEQLVREKLATRIFHGPRSRSPPPSYHASPVNLERKYPQIESDSSSRPQSTLETFDFVPPSPLTSPHSPDYNLTSLSPVEAPKSPPFTRPLGFSLDQDSLNNFQEQIIRMTSQLESVVYEQTTTQSDLQKTVKSLQEENLRLKHREVELQGELARKEVEFSEVEKLVDSMRFEVLEKDVTIKECLDRMEVIATEHASLTETVDTQAKQITSLLDLVASLESTIKDLHLNPRQNDLRLGFLRASVRSAEDEKAKSVSEAKALRQTISKQDQELKELRALLQEKQCSSLTSQGFINEDLTNLRKDHEGLKVQVKEIQVLLVQHLLPPHVQNLLEAEGDLTLVPDTSTPLPVLDIIPDLPLKDTTSSRSITSAPHPTQYRPSKTDSQLEYDLNLLRSDLLRKQYMGGEIVQRLTEHGLEPSLLDDICRVVDVHDDPKNVQVVVDRVREAIARGHVRNHVYSQSPPEDSAASTSSEEDEDEDEEDQEDHKHSSTRLPSIIPTVLGHLRFKTILKPSFKSEISSTRLHKVQKVH